MRIVIEKHILLFFFHIICLFCRLCVCNVFIIIIEAPRNVLNDAHNKHSKFTTENKQKIFFFDVVGARFRYRFLDFEATAAHTIKYNRNTEFCIFSFFSFCVFFLFNSLARISRDCDVRCVSLDLYFINFTAAKTQLKIKAHNRFLMRRENKTRMVLMSFDAARTGFLLIPPVLECCESYHIDVSCTMCGRIYRDIVLLASNLSQSLTIRFLVASAHDKCCPTITVALKHNTFLFCFCVSKQKSLYECKTNTNQT